MFTTNFFNDNSQLNYGRHLAKKIKWSRGARNTMVQLINSIRIARKNGVIRQNERIVLNRSLGMVIAMSLVVLAFEWKSYDRTDLISLNTVELSSEEVLEIPVTSQPPPKIPQKMPVTIIEVSDMEEIEEEIEIDLDIETNEDMIIEEVVYEEALPEIEEEETEEIFVIVEKQPQPIGGMSAFYEFVSREIKYPSAARRGNIEGKVFVQFVVNQDGELTDFQVVKGIGMGCDEEAIRVLKMAPKWYPGKQRGKEVKVRMILPITFVLQQ